MRRVLASLVFLLSVAPLIMSSASAYRVGVEWVEQYNGVLNLKDLSWTSEEAEGFYNALGNLGWTQLFDLGNDYAWESHFEKSAVGGSDIIDYVDFGYFSGHGSPDAFFFGTNHDGDGINPFRVHYSEAEWGDGNLNWIVISACEVLNNTVSDVSNRWGWPVFRGLHIILGFDTVSYDQPIWIIFPFWWDSPGERFVEYMTNERGPYPIVNAWMYTTIDWQPDDVYAAYLSTLENVGDYLPGYGPVAPDQNPPDALVWAKWQC